jgi:hypothetical protein
MISQYQVKEFAKSGGGPPVMTTVRLRHILRRRWYLVLVGLVGVAGLAFAASIAVPPTYEAKATAVLLPPIMRGTGANPYLALGGYQPFADVVAKAMMDVSKVDKLKTAGVTDKYAVVRDLTTSGPVLTASVSGRDSAAVVAETRTVLREIAPTVIQLQRLALVPQSAMIRSEVISRDTVASAVHRSQVRAIIAAAAFGALAALGLIVWLDTALIRRRDHKTESTDDDATAETTNAFGAGRSSRLGAPDPKTIPQPPKPLRSPTRARTMRNRRSA